LINENEEPILQSSETMNTKKILYGILTIATLSLAACSNDSDSGLYDGIERKDVTPDRNNIERKDVTPERNSIERKDVTPERNSGK